MKPFNTSLYWRLLIWFCVANLLVLVLGGLLARRFIAYSTRTQIDWIALSRSADRAYESGGREALAAWSAQQRIQGIEATLFQHGQPLYPTHLYRKLQAQLPDWLKSGQSIVVQPSADLAVAVQPVMGEDGQLRQLVAVSHTRLRPQARAEIHLAIQLLLALLFIGLVGWWLARSVSRPVEALRHVARRMANGELSARIERPRGMAHDELVQLAGDFNTMAERIEALVAHDRGVLQDLSHELRSPLARLQLILDLAKRSSSRAEAAPYFEQAEHEIAGLDRMLGDMLELSRMESGLPGTEREPVELAALARGCVEQCSLEASAHGVELCLASVDAIVVSGNPMLLEHAINNLLSNSIKFSPRGGSVEVALRCDRQTADLEVRDHGPGVPAEELPLLFRPFFRGSNAARAGGHGLGLAIAQRVVQVHAGSIEVRNAEGGGLEIHVRLPVA